MGDNRKIIRTTVDGPYIEVGSGHIKLCFDKDNFLVLNSGGITHQGKFNVQGSPTDTSYYGLFKLQNEFLGTFTAGVYSAPQYQISTEIFEMIPAIMSLAQSLMFFARL
jgi:hypothetical protein